VILSHMLYDSVDYQHFTQLHAREAGKNTRLQAGLPGLRGSGLPGLRALLYNLLYTSIANLW